MPTTNNIHYSTAYSQKRELKYHTQSIKSITITQSHP